MMEIDEKHLKSCARAVGELCDELTKIAEKMTSKDGDIFERFMAYRKLTATLAAIDFAMKAHRISLKDGFTLSHPFMVTDEAKECGWGKVNLEKHPFFVQGEDEDEDSGPPSLAHLAKLLKVLSDR